MVRPTAANIFGLSFSLSKGESGKDKYGNDESDKCESGMVESGMAEQMKSEVEVNIDRIVFSREMLRNEEALIIHIACFCKERESW